MAFESDRFVDRRRLKRRLFFWRALAVVAVVGVIAAAWGRFGEDGLSRIGGDYVAWFSVSGVIVDDNQQINALLRIRDDDRAKALVLHIDSPGGTIVGSEAHYEAVREIAEEKPVVAVLGETAASGGYMVAIAADRIYARRGTVTGSIGVIFQTMQVTEMLAKLGIEPQAIKSDPLKASPNPFEEMTEEARRASQALVDDMHEMFVGMVRERRNLTGERARELGDGRVYTGRIALKNGLIDGIGDEDAARDWLENEHSVSSSLPMKEIKPKRDVEDWVSYIDSRLGSLIFGNARRLDGLVALWHPHLR